MGSAWTSSIRPKLFAKHLDAAADRLDFYYGAADTVVCLASATFSDVMDYLRSCPRP